MKLSRVVALSEHQAQPIAAPSAVHVAMVEVLGELISFAVATGHPAAKIMKGVIPSILPDLAQIPTDSLALLCRRLGEMMIRVANAETEVPTHHLDQLLAEIAPDDAEPRPTEPALH